MDSENNHPDKEENAMNRQAAVDLLNKAVSLEYASAIMHQQHSLLVQGVNREVHSGLFRKMSESSFQHAREIGEYIVALGAVPTVEPATIRQSADLNEMLRLGLETEQTAFQTYKAGVSLASDDIPLRVMLEHLAQDEYLHMTEIEKMLGMKTLQIPASAKEVKLKQAG